MPDTPQQTPPPFPLTVLPPREAREKCGVAAVWGDPAPARQAFFALAALQHRGQESAGIAATNGHVLSVHVGMGLVTHVFDPETITSLDQHAASRPGPTGGVIGHNRYSTTGESLRANAQPFVGYLHGGQVAVAHNGNIVNAADIRRRLEAQGHAFHTTTDTEVVLQLLAQNSGGQDVSDDPLADTLAQLRGAFTLAFLFRDRIEVARDPWAWRPLVLGRTDSGALVAASESVALDVVGATLLREVEPGEIVTLSDEGIASRRFADPAPRLAQCVFEHVYFASPASNLFGRTVQLVREQLGERLHVESPVDADVVLAMPDSGRSAATGYARAARITYREGIIPNRYVGRTFIRPTAEERQAAVRMKLNIIADVVRDQRCIVVDDSIVRGTTTRAKMDQLRAAGAREVHLRIASPPIRHPCFFGIDFPEPEQLVAHNRDVEDIRKLLNVDSLHFISLEGLLATVGGSDAASRFCTACYSGDYPIEVDRHLRKNVLEKTC